jgi:sulfhydrogenase subunit beta (sulfur reductase)
VADHARLLDVGGLQRLIDVLLAHGYTVVAPTVRDGVIVHGSVTSVDELPRGWGDEQDAARYRLRQRGDDALFGYAASPQAAKPVTFPAEELLWRGRRDGDGFTVEEGRPEPAPVALLGVRSCDLSALAIHDTVLAKREYVDVRYAARRANALVISVACGSPAGTCFCVSMGTGPRPRSGFDLSLTELLDGGRHEFLVEVGTERGAELLREVPSQEAAVEDMSAADAVAADAAQRMGRTLDTDGLRDVLYAGAVSPHWDDVASRCLACTNCTLVCPTCFCTSVQDTADLAATVAERHRVWDSCFTEEFAYIHGGSLRKDVGARYRQWLTHKLGSWIDQFGTSGCVGCGRCITWCPAAIDITAEAAALRGTTESPRAASDTLEPTGSPA